MTIQEEGPLLCLRMKTPRTHPIVSKDQHDTTLDCLAVMVTQDASAYTCRDYLSPSSVSGTECKSVDPHCREKMCDWSYRVLDHFHGNREIVAVSMSYLDRFMDRLVSGCVDRCAFKLAAMTTLYMATKVFSDREISMTSLAELSRGEFDVSHMVEMERIILQTIEFRMHPPTAQCFIHHLCMWLPTGHFKPVTIKAIHQRACFFAELALFDAAFVSAPRFVVGLCALLNAMEGMSDASCGKTMDCMQEFLQALQDELDVEIPKDQVETLCGRLWYLYSQSSQYHHDDVAIQRTLTTEEQHQRPELSRSTTKEDDEGETHLSPVSVSRPT